MATAPPPVFPLTTADPASELALKLLVITEAIRMAGLGDAASQPQVVAALVQASAMADLTEAVTGAAVGIGAGLHEVAAAMS